MNIFHNCFFAIFLFHCTLSQDVSWHHDNIDRAGPLTKEELKFLSTLNEPGREKRFIGQAISSVALGSAASGSRAISSGLSKLIGSVSKGSSGGFGHSSSGGGHPSGGEYHYEAPVETHGSSGSGKLQEAWELKKIILSSLLQAAKAVNGGLLAIGGKLIKGSGHLIQAKGRFLSSKGDVVSNFGKNIVYSTKTASASGPSWSSGPGHSSIESSDHHSSGPGSSYGPPPSHFPSAPSISTGYGAPSNHHASYHSAEGDHAQSSRKGGYH